MNSLKATSSKWFILFVAIFLLLANATKGMSQLNCSGGPLNCGGAASVSSITNSGASTLTGAVTMSNLLNLNGTGGTSTNTNLQVDNDDTDVQFYASRNSGTAKNYKFYTRNSGGSLILTLADGGVSTFGHTVTAGVTSTVTVTTAAVQMRGRPVLLDGLPTCSGAGCVMGATSTNTAMNFTTTTTGASDITVTFSTAFTNAPSCFANNDTTGNISRVTTVTTGSIHVQGVTAAGDTLRVGCFGN